VTNTANPFHDLTLTPPPFDPDDAAALARDLFGVEGRVKELGSNQDRNFRIDTGAERLVLKVANPGWGLEALEAQNAAMAHLASASLTFTTPVVRPARDGSLIVPFDRGGETYQLRLTTYVEGVPLQDVPYRSTRALHAYGRLAGETVRALVSFDHPGLERVIQWDLRRAGQVVDALARFVPDAERRAQAVRVCRRAEQLLAPVEAGLPQHAVHADITDYNVMAAQDRAGRWLPTGLIDLGDLMRTWRISDLGVAIPSLAMHDPAHALEIAIAVVTGFHEVVALREDEAQAVWPLVLARAAVDAVSEEQLNALDPGNPYVEKAVAAAWTVFDGLEAIPPALAHEALRAAIGLGPSAASRAAAARIGELAATAVAPVPIATRDTVDLTVRTALLQHGVWNDLAATRAVTGTAGGVGRWGEARIVNATPETRDATASHHLGIDLVAPEGTAVVAPVAGTVAAVAPREVVLDADGVTFRLYGVTPSVAAGTRVSAGDQIGLLGPPSASSPLPAHVHLQAVVDAELPAPRLAVPALAAGWQALSPDPSALLGRHAAAPPEDPAALTGRRDAVVARVQEHYYERPPQIERGWRHHLYATDGRGYLDMVNNVAILGHSHPGVQGAVSRQLNLLNTNSRFQYELLTRASERLVEHAPAGFDQVFWVASGSEANDVALRLIRTATAARDVLTIQSAYHGWTLATDEVSTATYDNPRAAEKRPAWIHPVESPNTYRGRFRGADAAERYADDVDRVLAGLAAAGTPVAGLIAEAFYGNAGGIPLPDGYLDRVYAAVRAAGGLCIADEVQVGYGRLGEHFWSFEQQRVVPDVITIAKATGNGFPVGAVITTREIAERFARDGAFFSSTGGSPASCAAAIAVLDALEAEGLQENARVVGAHLKGRLQELCERHPICGTVHGMGLYLGLELVRDRETLEPAGEEAYAICDRLLELGIVVQPTSDGMNVLKIKPPLCITRESADYFVDTLDHVLETGW
jgi:4-aminobutyrate aminotransferase-like enzyme/Ser/Thr protein kinase RdoA (MazF antagonist)